MLRMSAVDEVMSSFNALPAALTADGQSVRPTRGIMKLSWELDHVFIATTDPQLESLASDFGLTFSERRTHRGQGTANACAIFENAFLELLFGVNRDELESETVRPLALSERVRWQDTGACPFGICFRPTEPVQEDTQLPVETWPYRPSYVPAGSSIPVVTPPRSLSEPVVFLMTRPRTPSAFARSALHRGSKRTLTSVSLQSPNKVESSALQWFIGQGLFSVSPGTEYVMELVWDGGSTGNVERLPGPIPLAFRW